MRKHAIVLAADLPTPAETLTAIKEVGTIVDGIKIGEATLLQAGVDILKRIRDMIEDRPLLVDLKIADIGFKGDGSWQGTNAKIIESIRDTGATHVTVHGFPGPTSVGEAAQRARELGIGVLLLPLMSHAGAALFFSRPVERSEVVYSTIKAGMDVHFPPELMCSDVTEGILMLGEALDVDGYIGPATRPLDLQRYRAITQKPIWCPGFGRQDRQGRNLEEQFKQWAEIVGPSSAAIVGSAIFGAKDRAAAAKEIVEIRDRVIG
jgi:orotidine 5'-phosphate decarboxylase subfamily 1